MICKYIYKFVLFILHRKFRYMRPGTRHYVVTTENCLAIGGHFYNRDNFSRTAIGIIHQHFLGVSLNNTEHSRATVILFRLVHQYYQCYHMENKDIAKCLRSCMFLILFGQISFLIVQKGIFPKPKELIWLMLVVFYLPYLSPENDEDAPAEVIWQTTDRFKYDYAHARDCVIGLGSCLGKEDSTFLSELEKTEEDFLNICHRFHELERASGREVKAGGLHGLCLS
jgi:hypothetical protein